MKNIRNAMKTSISSIISWTSLLLIGLKNDGTGCPTCCLAILQTSPQHKLPQQVYLDVEPVDTSRFFDIIREIKLSRYRLANEKGRTRIGFVGPDIAEMVPEAVELVPKRVFPPIEKGGEPIIYHNVPAVNENMLFMMSIGATQELIKRLNRVKESVAQQFHDLSKVFEEVAKLETLISHSSSEENELKIKASIAQAEVLQSEMELEIQRAQDEKKYNAEKKQMELLEIKRNEELTRMKIIQEDEAARRLAREEMEMKFFTTGLIERTKRDVNEALLNSQHKRDIMLQKLKEELKIKSAQVRHD
jgi:hypothetical protein